MRHTRCSTPIAALLLLAAIAVTGACDVLVDSTDDPGQDGTWGYADGGVTTYLRVSEDSVVFAVGRESTCYHRTAYEVIGTAGDTFHLRRVGWPSGAVTSYGFRRSGDALVLTWPGSDGPASRSFVPATVDLGVLTTCTGGAPLDPRVCEQLAPIVPGASADGQLTDADPVFHSRYYDLFSLVVDSAAELTVDLLSEAFDTYLWLYRSDGAVLAWNDQVPSTMWPAPTFASLTLEMGPGCYVVEATSAREFRSGPYTLRAR